MLMFDLLGGNTTGGNIVGGNVISLAIFGIIILSLIFCKCCRNNNSDVLSDVLSASVSNCCCA